MVTHVDNITNVKLPPVDTLTVLCTYISRSTLWFVLFLFGFFWGGFFWGFFFCVHVSLRSFYYIFYWTEWAVIGIHFNCCTWISSCTKIYILVIGKVALKSFFAFCTGEILYIVFAARPVEFIEYRGINCCMFRHTIKMLVYERIIIIMSMCNTLVCVLVQVTVREMRFLL